MAEAKELVNITVDGKQVQVPKGLNLIEAAAKVGVEVPYYCYHPNLSIAGNCRMCKVKVEGMPKLQIGCNTGATEGMIVSTHETSEEVARAQRSTLEFLLINHPLDCTVCDQAGHCKLQDYYYQYNAKAARFTENKVHKVKAEVLGPEVVYDGERCIMCTRCVRFCDEITETSELAALNRGDHAVIGIHPGRELNNALSGTVVDLCPVGALTHRRWRFNTRIWYTELEDTICTGCSTGCNAKVAVRDGEVVHVKARPNEAVNKEWMCDEGRYGFGRFQPKSRLTSPYEKVGGEFKSLPWEEALARATKLAQSSTEIGEVAVFLSPQLTLEEMWAATVFAKNVLGVNADSGRIAIQIRDRHLSSVEAILISPDYSANARAATVLGLVPDSDRWREDMLNSYNELLSDLRSGAVKRVLLVGDGAIASEDLDPQVEYALNQATSVAITPCGLANSTNGSSGELASAHRHCSLVLPSQTVHEKSGVMINRDGRIQRLKALLQPPFGALPDWLLLQRVAVIAKKKVVPDSVQDSRALFRQMVSELPQLSGLSLMRIGELGINLSDLNSPSTSSGETTASVHAA